MPCFDNNPLSGVIRLRFIWGSGFYTSTILFSTQEDQFQLISIKSVRTIDL